MQVDRVPRGCSCGLIPVYKKFVQAWSALTVKQTDSMLACAQNTYHVSAHTPLQNGHPANSTQELPHCLAGFSWQVHSASLKAMQSLLQKLQASSSEAVSQQHTACIAALLPGMSDCMPGSV